MLKKSKWIHKYVGLFLLLFISWMSISGILLNHPKLIENLSLAQFLTPSNYIPNNWNRSSLKGIVYTKNIKNDSVIMYGYEGIFIKKANSEKISPYTNGEYPQAPRLKRTNHIFADTVFNRLLAANNKGLYSCKQNSSKWEEIKLPNNHDEVKKIIKVKDKIIAVTASGFYSSNYAENLNFEQITPAKHQNESKIPLFRVFLELHDGSIFYLPGKILWDIAALVLFFACISGFYMWFYPKKWKRKYKRKKQRTTSKEKKSYRFFYKYHRKLAWYFSIIFLIVFITGIFLRPPLIILLVKGGVSRSWYPSFNSNPWHHKIHNALYDNLNNQIVLDCSDGTWTGNLSDDKGFTKQNIAVPVFAMGATVFEEKQPGLWLVGSFGGLYEYDYQLKKSTSLLDLPPAKGRGRPAAVLVTGYAKSESGKDYVLGHYKGVCNFKGVADTVAIPMPQVVKQNYKMPLWNFLFELHNGRIFRKWIGGFYIMIIPIGGLLGLFVLISGIFDYLAGKRKSSQIIKTSKGN